MTNGGYADEDIIVMGIRTVQGGRGGRKEEGRRGEERRGEGKGREGRGRRGGEGRRGEGWRRGTSLHTHMAFTT